MLKKLGGETKQAKQSELSCCGTRLPSLGRQKSAVKWVEWGALQRAVKAGGSQMVK